MVYGAANADGALPQPSGSLRIREEVVRQQAVQVQDRVTIDADFSGIVDEQFDRCLVVQDHLSLARILAFGALAQIQEPFRLQ